MRQSVNRTPFTRLDLHPAAEPTRRQPSWDLVARGLSPLVNVALFCIRQIWTPAQPLVVGLMVQMPPAYLLLPAAIDLQARAVETALSPPNQNIELATPEPLSPTPFFITPSIALVLMEQARLEREAQPQEVVDEESDAEIQRLQTLLDDAQARASLWFRRLGETERERDGLRDTVNALEGTLDTTQQTLDAAEGRLRALETFRDLGTVAVGSVDFALRQYPPGPVPPESEVQVRAIYSSERDYAASIADSLSWVVEECDATRLTLAAGSFVTFVPGSAGRCKVSLRTTWGTSDAPQDVTDFYVLVGPEAGPTDVPRR